MLLTANAIEILLCMKYKFIEKIVYGKNLCPHVFVDALRWVIHTFLNQANTNIFIKTFSVFAITFEQ